MHEISPLGRKTSGEFLFKARAPTMSPYLVVVIAAIVSPVLALAVAPSKSSWLRAQ